AWQHHLTIGRNQTEYQLEPVSPSLGRPADTLYSASRKVGKRNTLAYNMTLLPRQFSRLSSVITSGLNGSTSDQVTIEGWQPSRDATSYLSTSTIRATMAPKADSWGGFASLRVGIFNQLYVTTGFRGEYNPSYGKSHKIDWTP